MTTIAQARYIFFLNSKSLASEVDPVDAVDSKMSEPKSEARSEERGEERSDKH